MSYALRGDVTFCLINGQAIFLDISADRYFCLPPETNAIFVDAVSDHSVDPRQARYLEKFIGSGLLRRTDEFGITLRPAEYPAPERETGRVPTKPWRIARAVLRQINISHLKKPLAFQGALKRFRQARNRICASQVDSSVYSNVSSDFFSADVFLPALGKCVRRFLAIGYELLRYQAPVNLIIGVSWPLKAHCWVQKDGLVIGDSVDVVRSFTPILVV